MKCSQILLYNNKLIINDINSNNTNTKAILKNFRN